MPYNFVANSIHTNKLCIELSSSGVHFLTENGHFAFCAPFGGFRTTYLVHLMLIGKLVWDFLLVIIELYSLGKPITVEALTTEYQ